jgi:hypothetical protein
MSYAYDGLKEISSAVHDMFDTSGIVLDCIFFVPRWHCSFGGRVEGRIKQHSMLGFCIVKL